MNQLMKMAMTSAELASETALRMQREEGKESNIFQFIGGTEGFQKRMEEVKNHPDEINTKKQVRILIFGDQVKQMNFCCYCTTICLGCCLIIPCFFQFCNWWKKRVNAAFDVPLNVYRKLETVFSTPSIQKVTLNVIDNTFDDKKSQLILELLSKSRVKEFIFKNLAGPYDFENNEWSSFEENMKPIKNLKQIESTMEWGSTKIQ